MPSAPHAAIERPARFALSFVALAVACSPSRPTSTFETARTGGLTVCPATNAISDPQDFQWTLHPATANNPQAYYSGTLEIGEATFTIAGETLTTRAYRQAGGAYSIPGPTIRMTPGNKYVLRFHNTLPYEPASSEHNVYKDPNVSNVHTHGLHISGESPGDDVTRSFEGGFGGDFVYDIPADHMGGTFWYHAHHHGSTFLQVSAGAFGLLIIDDGGDGIPANVAAMRERQLVLAYLDPAAAGTGGDTLLRGTLSPTWTVNGAVQGAFCAPAGEWQHWRLLLADRDARLKTVSVGSSCEVALLARDGVWRSSAPKLLTGNAIALTGASRADLAVRCSDDSDLRVDGAVVANIHVAGAGDPAPHPYAADGVSSWSATRPAYLRDLRGAANVHRETINMGARTVNGSKFDAHVPTLSLAPDAVQEWTIKGATNHPFHLHVYHVQAEGCGGDFEDGEYYDTLAASCGVRFDLNAATSSVYRGRTVMHCHILAHEDQGAMGWLAVTGGTAAPSYPADGDLATPYAAHYPLGGGPPPPPDGDPPTAVTVGGLSVSTVGVGQGYKRGQAAVLVHDDRGNPVADAVVSGAFSGDFSEPVAASDPTDASGSTTLQSTATAKGGVSFSFCVTGIAHPTLAPFSGSVCAQL